MKTILITVSHGAVAKNILRTGVMAALLREPDVRVICLMRFPDRVCSYQKEIAHPRLVYDALYRSPGGVLERVLSFLKFRLIRTATTDWRHMASYDVHGNYIKYVVSSLFNRLIARRPVRAALRFVDYYLIGDPGFGALLEKYSPDLVFLTHLFDDAEISLLRESKKRGIATIGFINSWDKLTARCSLRLLPDHLIVFNDIVREEAVRYADMPADKITVSGIPQYDSYVSEKPVSREEFCRKTGLDPTRHIVLFAPIGSTYSDSDWEMIDLLHNLIDQTNAVGGAQLFVRFQPNDFLDTRELERRPWLKYDLPGVRFGKERSVDWDMGFSELSHLIGTLAHTAVLVCYSSSMSVDAAFFDKPVININFEMNPAVRPSKAPTLRYQTDHYIKALRPGGIRLVNSQVELVQWLNAYLNDSSRDRDGRARLVEEQCWRRDGKSGERVAAVALRALGVLRGGA